MSNKILFVFEGKRTEPQIVTSLKKGLLTDRICIESVFGAEIYQLYEKIKADEDLDTFSLLKERDDRSLNCFSRNDFSEIYLFFDYDGHATNANDDTIEALLGIFDNETEKGKLFISYPMVEALRHTTDHDTFEGTTVECQKRIGYKKIAADGGLQKYQNFESYSQKVWLELICAHLKKMNCIVTGEYILPKELIAQKTIFAHQRKKFIEPISAVSVLSAFPVFVHDYYGNKQLIEVLGGVGDFET